MGSRKWLGARSVKSSSSSCDVTARSAKFDTLNMEISLIPWTGKQQINSIFKNWLLQENKILIIDQQYTIESKNKK